MVFYLSNRKETKTEASKETCPFHLKATVATLVLVSIQNFLGTVERGTDAVLISFCNSLKHEE